MKRRVYRVRARPLLAALERLYDEGTALPAFTVGEYRIAFGPTNRRLYATRKDGRKVLGTITGSGLYRPPARVSKVEVASITALVEKPLDVARGAAILSGFDARCPVCRRLLDSKDRLQGIGPACYAKGQFWRLETDKSNRRNENAKDTRKEHRVRRERR